MSTADVVYMRSARIVLGFASAEWNILDGEVVVRVWLEFRINDQYS